jgi:hypothetical protein
MLRALLIIILFVGLLYGTAMSEEFRSVMALGGIFGACMGANWLITPHAKS